MSLTDTVEPNLSYLVLPFWFCPGELVFRSNPLQNQRPELTDNFDRGEEKVRRLMSMGSTRSLRAGETLISEGEEHDFVYRLRKGWAGPRPDAA